MSNILDSIQKPNDIRDIPPEYYPQLAQEIRDFLIEHISRTGGHLASNLGAVELTMALHLFLHFPEDISPTRTKFSPGARISLTRSGSTGG